jgi:hypothetical protein
VQRVWLVLAIFLSACPDEDDPSSDGGVVAADATTFPDAAPVDLGLDAGEPVDLGVIADGGDAAIDDAGTPPSCIDEGHAVGERYLVDDDCNFCDCLADGTTNCTARTCTVLNSPCVYDNVTRAYGERFPSIDGCNDCVCAASGLACTRRACPAGLEEGAILLETLTATCGPDARFTPQAVFDEMPYSVVNAPFLYDRARPSYPETLPDSTVDLRVVYDGGFLACRIPAPGQEALDIEVIIEWRTADGAFNEGFRGYLRKNAGGFVDAWYIFASAPLGGLDGTYVNTCFDPRDYSFDGQIDRDGSSFGAVTKVCESDILFTVGSWMIAP